MFGFGLQLFFEMELIQQQLSQLLLSKQSVKALVAIRFLPLLLERSLVQLFQAEAETRHMINDWLLALLGGHYNRNRDEVGLLTKKTPADEMLGMEFTEHGRDTASWDGLRRKGLLIIWRDKQC